MQTICEKKIIRISKPNINNEVKLASFVQLYEKSSVAVCIVEEKMQKVNPKQIFINKELKFSKQKLFNIYIYMLVSVHVCVCVNS